MSALDSPPPAAAPAPSAPKHPDLRAAMARVELRNEASKSPSDAALEEPRRVYEAIFGRWPATHGKIISKRERDARGMNASSLVYGEINFASSGAAKARDVPDFGGSDLGRRPLVSADVWTSDRPSERSRSVDAFCGTRARGTLALKRR